MSTAVPNVVIVLKNASSSSPARSRSGSDDLGAADVVVGGSC